MSTRGNYVFIEYPYKQDENGKWVKDPSQIVELKKGISDETPVIKDGYKVYIHSDSYPSYALPNLFEFLNFDASIARGDDSSYLSAWFVANQAVNDILKYRVAFSRDDLSFRDGSYEKFINEYAPQGKDISAINDFTGIGLLNALSDWANYTYVILADTSIENSFIHTNGFRIFIFDYEFNFIDEIHSTDDLEELKLLDWWD